MIQQIPKKSLIFCHKFFQLSTPRHLSLPMYFSSPFQSKINKIFDKGRRHTTQTRWSIENFFLLSKLIFMFLLFHFCSSLPLFCHFFRVKRAITIIEKYFMFSFCLVSRRGRNIIVIRYDICLIQNRSPVCGGNLPQTPSFPPSSPLFLQSRTLSILSTFFLANLTVFGFSVVFSSVFSSTWVFFRIRCARDRRRKLYVTLCVKQIMDVIMPSEHVKTMRKRFSKEN